MTAKCVDGGGVYAAEVRAFIDRENDNGLHKVATVEGRYPSNSFCPTLLGKHSVSEPFLMSGYGQGMCTTRKQSGTLSAKVSLMTSHPQPVRGRSQTAVGTHSIWRVVSTMADLEGGVLDEASSWQRLSPDETSQKHPERTGCEWRRHKCSSDGANARTTAPRQTQAQGPTGHKNS